MKRILVLFCFTIMGMAATAQSLKRVNPVIKDFGGIFEIANPDEKPDPNMKYNIVIEVEKVADAPDTLSWALNNVARLINLHAVGGVLPSNMNVVLAIHGGAAYTAMDNESYKRKYDYDNPNLKLYQQLQAAGVKMFICGQSLIARKIDRNHLVPEVKVAVSMLTTVTTYQLKGYAYLKF